MSHLRATALSALLLPGLLFGPGACAHAEPRGTLAALRPVAEGFHEAVRWRDFRRAASALVPEQRDAFEAARRAAHDARDLNVTDFEIEDAVLAANGREARVIARMQWYRLPSVTEQTETVVSHFVYRDGAWHLLRQEGGPFASDPAPTSATAPTLAPASAP
jgi:hypothetical protein